MVGLTLLLESQKKTINKSTPKVINKTSFILSSATHNKKLSHPSSSCNFFSSPLPPMTFLDACFLCKKKLLPGKDIYMYRGDRAFCSVDCRCRQICMDEESVRREYCSMAAKKPVASSSCSSSSSSRQSKSNKNRAGGFAY